MMKRSRFSGEQVTANLQEHNAGYKTANLCRMRGISSVEGEIERLGRELDAQLPVALTNERRLVRKAAPHPCMDGKYRCLLW